LNEEEISWLISIIQIAIMVSTLFSGLISDIFGRKKSLIIGQIFVFLGWILLYFAWNLYLLLTARCIMGVGVGIAYPNICLYVMEIALIRMRGTLAVMNTVMTNASFIYSLIFSATMPLQGLMIMSAIVPLLFLMVSHFLPESPNWLMKNGKYEETEKTILALRGAQYQHNLEIQDIQSVSDNQSVTGFWSTANELKSRQVLTPVLIMLGMFILQSLSGSDTIVFYSLDIFRRADVKLNNYVLSIFVQSGFLFGFMID